ncbi:MAG: FRG domain-containing protein, partial [Fusobacteriaceae bacterium]
MIIYENIFDAIKTKDGKIGAIPPGFMGVCYRGENQIFPNCKASIYRNNNKIERMRDEIKIIDFELILKKIPEVTEAEKNNQDINFLALAQHYELNTSLIDITSDLAIAAFFAVNKYNPEIKKYEIMETGVGVIKRLFSPIQIDENFEFIGYQIFKRPTYQHAFGIKTLRDIEEQPRFEKIYFKHSKIDNQKITGLFLKENKNELFPEEYISKIAKFLKNTNSVTKDALKIYCKNQSIKIEKV